MPAQTTSTVLNFLLEPKGPNPLEHLIGGVSAKERRKFHDAELHKQLDACCTRLQQARSGPPQQQNQIAQQPFNARLGNEMGKSL